MPTSADFSIGGSLIPANSTTDFKVTVRPLPLGATIKASPFPPLDSSWNGLIWESFASAVDQITVRVANVTAAGITPAVQGFKVHSFSDPSLG